MRRAILFALFLLSLCSAASAQNNVQWLGPVTAGNCITWFVPGIIKDSGVTCQQVVAPGGTNGQVQYNNAGSFGGLTNTQLTADINVVTPSLSGAAPASGGGTANFLRADGTWAVPAGPSTQGRLTLASGTPVMSATSCASGPCTSQGTIYYDCYQGNSVPYYAGSAGDTIDFIPGCEVSDALQTTGTGVVNANDVFDVWWVHSGANHICAATNGSGAGWSGDTGGSSTARGVGYTQLARGGANRSYVTNANSISHCYNGSVDYGSISSNQATYLGTFATTSSAGKVSFTFGTNNTTAVYGLWNYYNRVQVTSNVIDGGASYTYTSSTIRQARASSLNQIQFVIGVAEDNIETKYIGQILTSGAANAFGEIGLGFDLTNAFACQPGVTFAPTAVGFSSVMSSICSWSPGVGIHTLYALEKGDGTNANTFDNLSQNTLIATLRM